MQRERLELQCQSGMHDLGSSPCHFLKKPVAFALLTLVSLEVAVAAFYS